jgi:glucose/arabinose dehydrogenase
MTRLSSPALAALAALAFALVLPVLAETPKESDFYSIAQIPTPEGTVIEGGAIEALPEGRIAVCTRRGEVWIVENAASHPETPARWTLFAEGLHEPLGLAWREGWLYVVQRPEVTRLRDEDGDGRADLFETVADGWGINGNYHEYTFGSTFDRKGNLWCALCLTGSFTAESLYRGWILRLSPEGELVPVASGVRSPGGIGFNALGEVFYTDNQGAWNGSSSLKWVRPGGFLGNPNGNAFYEFAEGAAGGRPADPPYTEEGSRIEAERARIPQLVPPAVVLPHQKVGNSPTGIAPDLTGGKFGPFGGQLFVGEQTHSKIHRVFLEQVKGVYQGAMFPFLEGFQSGNIAVRLTDEGVLYTSGSDRGWGARGGRPFHFERVAWKGATPFEILEMRVRPEGFELVFTEAIDPATAVDASFRMEAYTYIYQKAYGSPEVDKVEPKVSVASVSDDGLGLLLKVEPLTKGHVHELHAEGLRSAAGGHPLLHRQAYYTLNEFAD